MFSQRATDGSLNPKRVAGSDMSRTHFAVAIIGAVAITVVASAQNTGPIIDSVSMRMELQRYETIYPEFHFHDPSGTVRFIHREITATNSPKPLKVRTE